MHHIAMLHKWTLGTVFFSPFIYAYNSYFTHGPLR